MRKKLLVAALGAGLIFSSLQKSSAQCAACKESAETSLQSGDSAANGLNAGIMYLLVVPYMLVGGIGYWWYRQHKKKEQEISSDQ